MDRFSHLAKAFRGAGGSKDILATDSGSIALTTVKASTYTIFIERVDVTFKTSAAQQITFEDTATTPTFVEKTDLNPGVGLKYTWEFPGGRPLAEGKNFVATLSAAGLAAHVQWQGHQRKTS